MVRWLHCRGPNNSTSTRVVNESDAVEVEILVVVVVVVVTVVEAI
jgi:hypothetical protein